MKEEVKYRTDEELEAMISQYTIKEPKLTCKNNKAVTRMCVNTSCQNNSLMCNEVDCDQCGTKNHLLCLSIMFNGVSHLLAKRADRQKNFVGDLCKIQNSFIEQLYKSRLQLTKKYYLGDLEEKYLKMFDEIYHKSNTEFLKGNEAKDLYDRLIRSNEQANQHANLLLQNYRNSMKKIVDSMIELKTKVYQSFVKVTNVQSDLTAIDSKILSRPLHTNLEEFKLYDSLIVKLSKSLVDELAVQQSNFLKNILNNPKQIQLLFRGSENGFNSATFHQKCDNIPNTLVLVRTEFGKTIGGFTQYTWNAAASNYVSEAGKKAFLFSLDLKEKYVPQNESNLIYCNPAYGPTFGGGHDLYVANSCHTSNSSAAFPSQYNRQGENKIAKNQDSYRAFSGASSSAAFRVVEYEVFRVTY